MKGVVRMKKKYEKPKYECITCEKSSKRLSSGSGVLGGTITLDIKVEKKKGTD